MTLRAQLLTLGGLLLMIGVVDFVARVYVGRDAALRAFHAQIALPLPPADSSDAIHRRMVGWLPAIAGADHAAPDSADPTAWRLSLAAVFVQRGKTIAVVAASQPAGGPVEKLRVVEGDTIHGWTVTHADAYGVTLTRETETRQLVLFKRGQSRPGVAGPGRH